MLSLYCAKYSEYIVQNKDITILIISPNIDNNLSSFKLFYENRNT